VEKIEDYDRTIEVFEEMKESGKSPFSKENIERRKKKNSEENEKKESEGERGREDGETVKKDKEKEKEKEGEEGEESEKWEKKDGVVILARLAIFLFCCLFFLFVFSSSPILFPLPLLSSLSLSHSLLPSLSLFFLSLAQRLPSLAISPSTFK